MFSFNYIGIAAAVPVFSRYLGTIFELFSYQWALILVFLVLLNYAPRLVWEMQGMFKHLT